MSSREYTSMDAVVDLLVEIKTLLERLTELAEPPKITYVVTSAPIGWNHVPGEIT